MSFVTEKVKEQFTLLPPSDSPLQNLSKEEKEFLVESTSGTEAHQIMRQCMLAVLNTGSRTDDVQKLLNQYHDFDFRVTMGPRGVQVKIENVPSEAFNLEGKILGGVRQHVFAVLRDIAYTHLHAGVMETPEQISEGVYKIARNAGLFTEVDPRKMNPRVFCWGGHRIDLPEYEFSKEYGYYLGLSNFEMITGCGDGAMKGPIKGAVLAHRKLEQTRTSYPYKYMGFTEPGIIGAEPPNAMINPLVIFPDIEKRQEAFIRAATGGTVLAGGVGTAEEIQTMLAVLMDPRNEGIEYPFAFAGPLKTKEYFKQMDEFLVSAYGPKVKTKYKNLSGMEAKDAAKEMIEWCRKAQTQRRHKGENYLWNQSLHYPYGMQEAFRPSHESVKKLVLSRDLHVSELMANVRKLFTAIVWGNVKAEGREAIEKQGKLRINVQDPTLLKHIDSLLSSFAQDGRMRYGAYAPCYEVAGGQTPPL